MITSNVFCAAFSFGTRRIIATLADVNALPCGCRRLTVAWPLASGVSAGSAPAATAPSRMVFLAFIGLRLLGDRGVVRASERADRKCNVEDGPLALAQHPAGDLDL